MKHQSTKTYPHELGLSACFRQWRATSHCNRLHGYALAFKFTFGADFLDDRGWVVDFGGLKELKERLVETFDHRTVVAGDDPQLEVFQLMNRTQVADVLVLPEGVGCERFARMAFAMAAEIIAQHEIEDGRWDKPRVKVISCECFEHGANSAIYVNPDL